jgi:hypothetical protein
MKAALLGPGAVSPADSAAFKPTRPVAERKPKAASAPRDANWRLELLTAMVMAPIGAAVLQYALQSFYWSLVLGALTIGGIGWFIGDIIFQAMAQPGESSAAAASNRPTQRLVYFTRQLQRRVSPAQFAVMIVALVGVAVLAAWFLGPLLFDIPVLWNSLPSYAVIGPLVYAATGHRRGATFVAHTLVATVGGLFLRERVGLGYGVGSLLLASAGGGLLMEAVGDLARRLWFDR